MYVLFPTPGPYLSDPATSLHVPCNTTWRLQYILVAPNSCDRLVGGEPELGPSMQLELSFTLRVKRLTDIGMLSICQIVFTYPGVISGAQLYFTGCENIH